jgi:hypothetical protein
MTYPRRITWQPGISAHGPAPAPRSQRDLVAASLLAVGPRQPLRWDERTRTAYAPRPR